MRSTRRANQRHIFIIADIVKLAPVNRPRAFFICSDATADKFQIIEPVSLHFQ